MENTKIFFTHQYIHDFGFEVTIYQPSDFESVEEVCKNEIDEVIFIGTFSSKKTKILKGRYL